MVSRIMQGEKKKMEKSHLRFWEKNTRLTIRGQRKKGGKSRQEGFMGTGKGRRGSNDPRGDVELTIKNTDGGTSQTEGVTGTHKLNAGGA